MKNIIIISILIFSFAGAVNSYSDNQRIECISNALNNPSTKSISEHSIRNYCDCALKAIIDQNKGIRESGYECALKYFK